MSQLNPRSSDHFEFKVRKLFSLVLPTLKQSFKRRLLWLTSTQLIEHNAVAASYTQHIWMNSFVFPLIFAFFVFINNTAFAHQRRLMVTKQPWLASVSGIAEAIPPVTPDDSRPSVQQLIERHAECIQQVRSILQDDPLFHADIHDDLWILRFVLSHKSRVNKAARAAKGTLAYRKQYQLDATDLRTCNLHDPAAMSPAAQRFMGYCEGNTVRYVIPDAMRGVIGFYKLSGLNQHLLVKDLDEEDWEETFRFIAEWIFQWNDYITRTTGRLTKSIRVMDVSDIPLSDISYECARRVAKAATVMEEFYPQNLQSAFICEAPVWAALPWRIMRPIIPKRLVEKLDFVSPGERQRDMKRLLQHISLENLPTRYGGKFRAWPVAFQLPKLAQDAMVLS